MARLGHPAIQFQDYQITQLPDSRLHVPVIDNADDAGIDWRLGGMERKAGLLAANEEDLLADTRANGVNRHQRPADRLMIGRERLHDQQLDAGQLLVFSCGDDVTNDPG